MESVRATTMFVRDDHRVHERWRELVRAHAVSGRQVHDARIVAAMDMSGIDTIVTKNARDFRRYDWIRAVDPDEM